MYLVIDKERALKKTILPQEHTSTDNTWMDSFEETPIEEIDDVKVLNMMLSSVLIDVQNKDRFGFNILYLERRIDRIRKRLCEIRMNKLYDILK